MTDTTANSHKMPRRPVTAYLLFQQDQNLKGIWNSLSNKERAKYEAQHAKDKIRYEKEKAAWEEAGGKDQTDIPKPKQTLSVYMFFSQDQKIGEKWREASQEVKDDYKARAKALLEQYNEDIAAYEEKYGANVLDAPDWPKRPLAAYMRFAKESRKEFAATFPDLSTSDIGKKLGAAWNEMSDEDRQEYIDAYEADHEQYLKDVDEYEAEFGEIKFIKKARAKARAEEVKEENKKAQQAKREAQREKNKRRREKEQAKEKREKAKAKEAKDKEREKKHRLVEQEKALRRAFVFYKKEHRVKMKKRFPELSAAEINEKIEEKWNDLVLSTQKSWVRRAILDKESKAAAVDEDEDDAEDDSADKKKKTKKTAITGTKRAREEEEAEAEEEEEEETNDEGDADIDDDEEAEESTAVEKPAAKKAKKAAATKKSKEGPTAADLKKALAFYTKQEKPKYKKREPEAKAAAINKQIKEKWTSLTDKTRAKYLRLAIGDTENAEVDA